MQTCISSSPPSLIRAVPGSGSFGQRVPGFPAVRSGLEGFCVPTLPFIGIPTRKVLPHKSKKCFLLEIDPIHYLHELTHYSIFRGPLGQLIRWRYSILPGAILTLIIGEPLIYKGTVSQLEVPIVVPLTPDPSGTVLQKIWEGVLFSNKIMLPWEEAIAVCNSLNQAYDEGFISTKELRELERELTDTYSVIDGFQEAYNITRSF
jgi:hypothetical protein